MCGIFCSIIYNQNTFLNEISKKGPLGESNPTYGACEQSFLRRGPDAFGELNVDVSECTILQLAACVLWTQGQSVFPQPVVDEDENILLWNGDIFSSDLAEDGQNDTETVSKRLTDCIRSGRCITEVFEEILGPYSFIFYHKCENKLYFGRDAIGRRSLVLQWDQRNVTISSISHRSAPSDSELPAVGIFCFDLSEDGSLPLSVWPWSHITTDSVRLKLANFPDAENIGILEPVKSPVSVKSWESIEPTESELSLWVVFRQEMSISQLMDKLSVTDSKTRIKRTMTALSDKPDVQNLITQLLKHLTESVNVRLQNIPPYCRDCVKEREECSHAKVAVLFSGGLDSAVLALLADSFVHPDEPIDLFNVAFERKKDTGDGKLSRRPSMNGVYSLVQEVTFMVPDRETGLQTLAELRSLRPNRKWQFVEINVTQEELKREREAQIADLIHPLGTVLDESLGCALWFASRGAGVLAASKQPYVSPARIILSGIGADEQLGGYMRHRTTLRHKGGWSALSDELCVELGRIAERNLGRDDRITSSHGRQCRMPYLDEHLVNFLSSLKPWERCNPIDAMAPGLGDKILLRLSAWHLGLRAAANLPKRAMQFGSRIANSKERGDAVSERL